MTLEWTHTYNQRGVWNWYCHLPNGWVAIVTDMSQEPGQIRRFPPTTYLVSASSKEDSITLQADGGPMEYDTFHDAKTAALLLASEQAMPLEMIGLAEDDEEEHVGLDALALPPYCEDTENEADDEGDVNG